MTRRLKQMLWGAFTALGIVGTALFAPVYAQDDNRQSGGSSSQSNRSDRGSVEYDVDIYDYSDGLYDDGNSDRNVYEYGYYNDGYNDDDWYYDYSYDDYEEAHYNWWGGYDDAGEEGLFDW